MTDAVPIFRLKRKARLLSRSDGMPLHAALDRVAAAEGFASWSLLVARREHSNGDHGAADVYARLAPGDLVVIGARPGQGKTLMGLRLAVEAMQAGHHAAFFSLEYAERHMLDRFRAIGIDPRDFGPRFLFDCSDMISSDYVAARLADALPGTLAVIDYLQILDQNREKPDLATQLRALKTFARQSGVVFVFISQIDRSYDASVRPLPGLHDVRQPNPLDLSLFDKACFLQAGRIGFSDCSIAA
jgi:hypothetical protein